MNRTYQVNDFVRPRDDADFGDTDALRGQICTVTDVDSRDASLPYQVRGPEGATQWFSADELEPAFVVGTTVRCREDAIYGSDALRAKMAGQTGTITTVRTFETKYPFIVTVGTVTQEFGASELDWIAAPASPTDPPATVVETAAAETVSEPDVRTRDYMCGYAEAYEEVIRQVVVDDVFDAEDPDYHEGYAAGLRQAVADLVHEVTTGERISRCYV